MVPAVLHKRPGQEPALAVGAVGLRVEVGAQRGPEELLVDDVRRAAVVRHQRDGGGHVAAHAVASDRELGAVDAQVVAVLAHPHGRRVGLLDLDGVASLGDGRVFGEHGDRSGPDDEVAHEALVVLEVAGDPDGAVEEHEYRQRSADALGANDVERDGAAIDRKLALCDLDAGDVHRCLVLQAGDDRPGLVAGQLPERAAVLIELPEKRARAAVDRGILGRIERRAVDHACHGSSFLLSRG